MIDRVALRVRRAFLHIEENARREHCVYCSLDEDDGCYFGCEAVFATIEEAERYVTNYGSDEHVAALRASCERDRRAVSQALIISKLLRGEDII